ncbi:MAG: tetratricopeptide repeat protein [Treponema sp.]|jgi:tetratricopeptide (TPR) repeat protein|nr:tetratricopeptide repeat protein [Treponema sp.]
MPSLEDLEAFKTSFRTVGNEDVIPQDSPGEDLALPNAGGGTAEPAPPQVPENTPDTGVVPEEAQGGNPVDTEDDWDDEGDADFSDLLSPELSWSDPAGSAPPKPDAPPQAEQELSSVDLDKDLAAAGDSAESDSPHAEEVPPFDLPPEDVFSFDDLESSPGSEASPEEPDSLPAAELPALDLPPEDAISFDDLEASLKSEAPPEKPEQHATLRPGKDIFSLGDDMEHPLEGLPPDTFDAFKTEEGMRSGEDSAGVSAPYPYGVDEDLAAIKPATDVEEIQLTDEELARLQKTLNSYPLNLRIACEEAIAEQAVEPALMSKLVKSLIHGVSAKEMVPLVGKILGRIIIIPKTFEKQTGEALEAEQSSFRYIFVHTFLPMFRLFLMIALVVASLGYLLYRFVYTPIRAELIYKKGYEYLGAGDYTQANEQFKEALGIHRVKRWFYRYAEGFKDDRQYIYAEEKYDELLRYYPRDKKGVLDYAYMETTHLNNYEKADRILRRNLLDYTADDKECLLAVGDNALAWGDIEPERYEDARQAYARYLEKYGWIDPVIERMLKYFIRTDNLKEVLPLQSYFMDNPRTSITPATLAELGGYLLDKKFEEVRGVPNEYISHIDGIRDILVKAAGADPSLPEPHYHLARYYEYFDNVEDERITLARAIQAFDTAPEESVRSLTMRIDTERRYARSLSNSKEFFAAEEHLIKGVGLYEDGVSRKLLSRSPQFGRLYADLGDLAYFTQDGYMETALEYYVQAEQNRWAPPEMQYRMGSAHYYQRQWGPALEHFFAASSEIPLNRRLLNALGNVSYMRGDYFTAQGYYSRLLTLLDAERNRFPLLLPNEQPEHLELVERLMVTRNNLGVTLEALTEQTGNNRYRSEAMGLYMESARAWDALTRNPETMVRFGAGDLSTPGINLAFLNSQNTLHPEPDYEPQIYPQIDKDVLEPSPWEALTSQNTRLFDTLF